MSARTQRLNARQEKTAELAAKLREEKRQLWHKRGKESCKKLEEIRAKKREQQRQRREAIKKDPERYQQEKEKERKRWLQRVKDGKVKSMCDMSSREKRIVRKRRRISMEKYLQKKEKINPFSIPVEDTNEASQNICLSTPKKNCDGRNAAGRKKLKAERARVYKHNQALKNVNLKLRQKIWRQEKQLQIIKSKQLTPRSKLNKELKGKKVSPIVKKKLLFGEVLKTQLKVNMSKFKSVKAKIVAHKLMAVNVIKKYKMLKQCTPFLSMQLLRKYRQEGFITSAALETTRRESHKKKTNIERIHDFFIREDVSSECPDKKAVKIKFGKNKTKLRKRYLRGTMRDLYKIYCKSVEKPLDYTKFCLYKPFNVVKPNLQERDTCLCDKCENMSLLVQALNRNKVLEETTGLSLIRSLCCLERSDKCMQRKCDECKYKLVNFLSCDENKVVAYKKWVTIQEERKVRKKQSAEAQQVNLQKKKQSKKSKRSGNSSAQQNQEKNDDTYETKIVKRNIKKSFYKSLGDMKKELLEQLEKYMGHVFRDFHQLNVLRQMRLTLGPSDLYLWIDFSENYQCKYWREIQSHYYGASREEVKLHTGMAYLEGEKHAFCSLSQCLRSDPAAILAHLKPVLEKYMKPGISCLHMQSDSPTTQYRNKTMFYLTVTEIAKLYPQLTSIVWNFTEAGHGKGAPDGVGGRTKCEVDEAVKQQNDVDTFEKVVELLQGKNSKVLYFVVNEAQVREVEDIIPSHIETFPGTMSVHQYTWSKEHPEVICFNTVSCYDCPAGQKCEHYSLSNSPWSIVKGHSVNPTEHNPDEPEIETDRNANIIPSPAEPVKKGDWVAVRYGNHWYPGKHLSFSKTNFAFS